MEIIQNNDWVLTIDLNGGRIKELSYKGEKVLGTFERIDGKQGNTHICCPNFGGEGMEKFGLPFHGPFRNLEWNIVYKDENKIEIEIESLDLKIKQIFGLTDSFEQRVIVKNLSNKSRLINMAIHNYWDTKNDWQGTKLNNQLIDELVKSDSDQKLLSKNTLEIPGKLKYKWDLEGFKYGRFWTSFKEVEEKKEYDSDYVCIEPSWEKQGFLDKGENNLFGLATFEFKQKIEI